VDVLEAFAAEGLAVFSGSLPEGTALKFLQNMVLTALKANLGYLGECHVVLSFFGKMPSTSPQSPAVASLLDSHNTGAAVLGVECTQPHCRPSSA
jgi:hypothetical protein